MLKIKNKIEFETNLWVAEVDALKANSSQENRIKFVTDIASICKGRLGFEGTEEQRLKLYNRLLAESNNQPSTPFEFVPIYLDYHSGLLNYISLADFVNNILRYGYLTNDGRFLTNLRALLKSGFNIEDIPFNNAKEVEGFKVIVGRIPKQVYDHIVMHRSFSRISESSRNKKYLNEVEFWIDSQQSTDLQEMEKFDNKQSVGKAFQYIERGMKAEQATKRLPCTRLVTFALAAWKQDENSWSDLFNIRKEGTGTQSITQIVVDNIKKLINEK